MAASNSFSIFGFGKRGWQGGAIVGCKLVEGSSQRSAYRSSHSVPESGPQCIRYQRNQLAV